MSDIKSSSRFASATVMRFLKVATKGQRAWYMAQGEPQALHGSFMDKKTFQIEERILPGLRHIIVGDAVATQEEAIRVATKVKAKLLADGGLEPFDERAAGIDDEAVDLAERFLDAGVRLDRIIHIGAMIGDEGCDDLRDMLEEIDLEDGTALFDDLPFLRDVLKPEEHETGGDEGEGEGDGDGDGDDRPRRPDIAEIVDMFTTRAQDEGTMGFIVQVSVPEHEPHAGSGGGASVHMGVRHTERFYASTFQVACDRAIAWGEAEIARTMARKAA